MPMSTIFQIVEIGTARSAQCDLGFISQLILYTKLVLSFIQNNMNHEIFNVQVDDISDAISELPNDKAPGIDGLMSEHFA